MADSWEQDIENAVFEGRQQLAESTQSVAPKPLDAVKVEPEDKVFDWQNRGPDYWPKIAADAIAEAQRKPLKPGQTVAGQALIAMVKHDLEMKRRAG